LSILREVLGLPIPYIYPKKLEKFLAPQVRGHMFTKWYLEWARQTHGVLSSTPADFGLNRINKRAFN
jgi:hypothetical protein